MKDGLIHSNVKEMIEKMEGELTAVIEDFLRAVDVEALYLAKKNGKYTISQTGNIAFSMVPCRGRTSGRAAQICRGGVSPAASLHGRDPENSPQGNNGLGGQYPGTGRCPPEQYILALRLTRNREIIVGPFALCNAT